jgi:hypothetical protein
MKVELVYEGLKLGSVPLRREGDRLFVEFSEPLPVGASLMLIDEEGERLVEVARVVETSPAGMWLRERAQALPHLSSTRSLAERTATEPASSVQPPLAASEEERGGRKGRRRSKTFIGR